MSGITCSATSRRVWSRVARGGRIITWLSPAAPSSSRRRARSSAVPTRHEAWVDQLGRDERPLLVEHPAVVALVDALVEALGVDLVEDRHVVVPEREAGVTLGTSGLLPLLVDVVQGGDGEGATLGADPVAVDGFARLQHHHRGQRARHERVAVEDIVPASSAAALRRAHVRSRSSTSGWIDMTRPSPWRTAAAIARGPNPDTYRGYARLERNEAIVGHEVADRSGAAPEGDLGLLTVEQLAQLDEIALELGDRHRFGAHHADRRVAGPDAAEHGPGASRLIVAWAAAVTAPCGCRRRRLRCRCGCAGCAARRAPS